MCEKYFWWIMRWASLAFKQLLVMGSDFILGYSSFVVAQLRIVEDRQRCKRFDLSIERGDIHRKTAAPLKTGVPAFGLGFAQGGFDFGCTIFAWVIWMEGFCFMGSCRSRGGRIQL
ncbi:hypothetical protein ACFL6U_09560 [Planctomycetota bacterium]